MKKVITGILAASTITLVLPAFAQFGKVEDAVKYRQSAMFILAQNFGRVAAMANGKIPFDAKSASDSAAIAEYVGKLPWAGFTAGSDKGETKSKPEIWTEKSKFDDLANKLQLELEKLATAAKAGNLEGIKAEVNASGRICKSCHDDFRAR